PPAPGRSSCPPVPPGGPWRSPEGSARGNRPGPSGRDRAASPPRRKARYRRRKRSSAGARPRPERGPRPHRTAPRSAGDPAPSASSRCRQRLMEPRPGEPPLALDRARRHVEEVGDLRLRQATEVTQLDDLGLARVLDLHPIERPVKGEDVLERQGGREI